MKKTVLIFGLISGAIVSTLMAFSMIACASDADATHSGTSMLIGYLTMILSFSFIFVGIKNLRDKHNGGVISFKDAFRTGLGIAFIASTMYVLVWAIVYNTVLPDFMEMYTTKYINGLNAEGLTPAEIQEKTSSALKNKERYKNPLYFAAITYAEILPLGIVVSAICALILKKKPKVIIA